MDDAPQPPAPRLAIDGTLWITAGDANLGGRGRIGLLRAVAAEGSITKAAKAFGMSYKAAWDAIDAMNRVAGEPLVERVTGGKGGGSTRLTDRGRRLVERFAQIDAVHRRFLGLLDAPASDLEREFSLLQVVNMRTSARNQFIGTVTAVQPGAVNDEIELALTGGARLVAQVTRESTSALDLQPGQAAIALVKSSHIVLAVDLGTARVSARNQWHGTVRSVRTGAVNAEVELEIAAGQVIVATVAQSSVDALGIAPGASATALVQASDVVLAVQT
jgi:molybdate transport system regulatory protein